MNSRIRILSAAPMICVVPNVADAALCRSIKEHCAGLLEPSPTISEVGKVVSQVRTSESCRFPSRNDERCVPLLQRFAEISGEPMDHFENPTVIRYQPGQYYKPHLDAFSNDKSGHREHLERAGQRVNTFILSLQRAADGGETHFSRLGVSVALNEGELLIFHNLEEQKRPSMRIVHESLPVRGGEKWIFTTWSRERPMPDGRRAHPG